MHVRAENPDRKLTGMIFGLNEAVCQSFRSTEEEIEWKQRAIDLSDGVIVTVKMNLLFLRTIDVITAFLN